MSKVNSELKNRSKKTKASPKKNLEETQKDDLDLDSKDKSKEIDKGAEEVPVKLKYGPMPTFSGQRVWSRSALILGLMAVVYFSSRTKESSFGKYGENIPGKSFTLKCSDKYENDINRFEGCKLTKCSRVLTDSLLLTGEIYALTELASRVLTLSPKSSAIYDLMTGKLIHDKEISLISLNSTGKNILFKYGDLKAIQNIELKSRSLIGDHFKVDMWSIRLNNAFFSSMTPTGKRSEFMTFPIVHQDAFSTHFSTIIYLSDYGVDFKGGRLIFPDSDSTNRTVEAQKGRVMSFTSGFENRYNTELVTKGKLISLVLGFTCDKNQKIGKILLT